MNKISGIQLQNHLLLPREDVWDTFPKSVSVKVDGGPQGGERSEAVDESSSKMLLRHL